MPHTSPSRRAVPLTALVLFLAAVGCSSGTGDEPVATSSTSIPAPAGGEEPSWSALDPTATGEGITAGFGDHVVAVPGGDPRGELLVFFPGTGAEPNWYSTFLEQAAGLGYHVIGLAYPNDLSVNFDLCQGSTDPRCAVDAREEILRGTDAPGLDLAIPPQDSAIPRLVAALEHLTETDPGGGWDRYLDPDATPTWSRIATAGHSQGGGHAAFLARSEEVARVVLLDATEPAPWTTEPMATPASRMWGLAHADEPIVAPIERSWENLGLPGEPVDIDAAVAPWGNSHRLITSTDECRGDPASRGYHHNCPVVDEYLPDPVPPSLIAAWDQLLTG